MGLEPGADFLLHAGASGRIKQPEFKRLPIRGEGMAPACVNWSDEADDFGSESACECTNVEMVDCEGQEQS